ncbi:hypothetical protein M433DRAFT_10042, partial [Acidomyces richmondensis BFW]
MEHGPHHAYPISNGTHGPPPPNAPPPPPPPPHHEQHPQYMTPVLETAHGPYGPPPQPMHPQHGYAGPISAAQFQVQRKKQMRATQACEQCRARKQKCDEGSPCSFCKENNLSCQYRDAPPTKTDKNMEKLFELMKTQSDEMKSLSTYMKDISSMLDDMVARLKRLQNSKPKDSAGASSHDNMDGDTMKRNETYGDHRTAPHKLMLLWPSVRQLLDDANIGFGHGY